MVELYVRADFSGEAPSPDACAVADRRISHGCVNVSEAFYDGFIRPTFAGTEGIVYILPETRSAHEEFHIPVVGQARVGGAAAWGA